jgi:hypothetical protein
MSKRPSGNDSVPLARQPALRTHAAARQKLMVLGVATRNRVSGIAIRYLSFASHRLSPFIGLAMYYTLHSFDYAG